MITQKQIDQDYTVASNSNLGVVTEGISVEILNTETFTLESLPTVGMLIVSIPELNKDSIYLVSNSSGTKTLTELVTTALMSDTEDTANSLNVYFDTNVLTIQNLLPASADATVTIKFIG